MISISEYNGDVIKNINDLLKNPYPDSRLIWGDELLDTEIKSIVCGIDISGKYAYVVDQDEGLTIL